MSWDTGNSGAAVSASQAEDAGGDTWNEGGVVIPAVDGEDAWGGAIDINADDHAGGGGGEGGDDTCRNCGQTGHFSRECPEPKQFTGECFNCGQVGHNKADCPNPKVERPFAGTCRICEKEGHPAKECPDKPPEECRVCKKPGHKAIECTELRTDIFDSVPDMSVTEAWEAMLKADKEKDIDSFKDAFYAYAKATATDAVAGKGEALDLADLEQGFRTDHRNVYFIGKEREVPDTMTVVSPAGKINQKYTLVFSWSAKPMRAKQKVGWPSNPEENLERLKSCGTPFDRRIPKCDNCSELGHVRKHCKQEHNEPSFKQPEIKCTVCGETGHRARDCQQERVDRFACRNCKKSGHTKDECTEPRSAEGVECRKCLETGHFSKDCPNAKPITCRNCGQEGHMSKECTEPKSAANVTCKNCDELGHFSRDCPKPRDYSRVQCKNCDEFGHTAVRCKAPKKEEAEGDGGYGGSGSGGFEGNDSGGFEGGDPVTAPGGWESGNVDADGGVPVASAW